MPLANITLLRGKPRGCRRAIADSVHDALVEVVGIPRDDRFQIINERDEDNLIVDRGYLGIQITLGAGRSRDIRVALHRRIAEATGGQSRHATRGRLRGAR